MQRKTIQLPSDADATGRSFGDEELALLQQVIGSGVLNSTRGAMTPRLEKRFGEYLDASAELQVRAVSSGTAAVHCALAALDPEPGDEVITTPITDMGAITPIVYQTAIPVFADVDPQTYNVTAETLAAKITGRTRAVIVTHLFGLPCAMEPIVELCRAHGLMLIEDCAQAFGARYNGRPVGRFGDIACFSLQQGKHMSCGEGGLVVTADAELGRRVRLFSDKAWGYGDATPDHYFLALNYRLTELQAAVALAQLEKLPSMVEQRQKMAALLDAAIDSLPGVTVPRRSPGAEHVFWKYALDVDPAVVPGGTVALGEKLKAAGVFCAPRYVQKPAFECAVLRDRQTFGGSGFPFEGPHRNGCDPVIYDRADTPGAIRALDRVLVLPINERYTASSVEHVAATLDRSLEALEVAREATRQVAEEVVG